MFESSHKKKNVRVGGDFERRVVTELPKEMLKKPKLKKYGGGSGNGESDDDKEVYKPVFPKRNNINKHGMVKSFSFFILIQSRLAQASY